MKNKAETDREAILRIFAKPQVNLVRSGKYTSENFVESDGVEMLEFDGSYNTVVQLRFDEDGSLIEVFGWGD